ncbi:MAG: ABC transporter ATP-binding protein [Parvibaculaceae bacterium]
MTGIHGRLEVRALAKMYGGLKILRDVSFFVEPGEFVTLLGPSGSGKTTTLKIIAGLERPSSGQVVVSGRDITRLPARERNLGLVFQQYALFPHMTVGENIGYPLMIRRRPKAVREARVDSLLEVASLTGLKQRRPGELSGGQQQRVALMRALAHEPPVVLLDEPLGALDRNLREQMQTELKRIQSKFGVTMIYVTHDQDEALSLSDRIVVMANGRIEQIGTPQEIYAEPRTAFVARFIGTGNLFRGTITADASAGGYGTIRVKEIGMIEARIARPAKAGEEASILIRPEHVRIGPCAQSEPRNSFRVAGAELKAYLGNVRRYEVRLRAGSAIDLELHGTRPLTATDGGDGNLSLEIAREHAVILPETKE